MIIEFWHWWVVAAILGLLDMVARSGFFLWLGVSAFVVGVCSYVVTDLLWQIQFVVFAGCAITFVLLTRLYLRHEPVVSDRPTLNRRGLQYIGQLIVLESAIVNGRGRAFVGDTLWTVEGSDLPAGETVRVIGNDGVLLQVEKADPESLIHPVRSGA